MRRCLPKLVIAVPCAADWRAMEPIAGDSRARLCRACDKPVYDSNAMTRAELHALIEKTEGTLPCLRLHQRPDGTIVTRGCLGALYRTGRFVWLKAAALAVAFWTSVLGLRDFVDVATTPAVEIFWGPDATRMTQGMVSILRSRPEPPPPWLRPPTRKSDVDRAPPLRVLESEQALLPPGWRE